MSIIRCSFLNNIPSKKLDQYLKDIEISNQDERVKNTLTTAILRYAESNINMTYWNLNMEKDFHGDPNLRKEYDNYIVNIKETFTTGKSICFAGNNGVGKTMTASCILKKVVQKSYTGLYTTLSDVVAVLTQGLNDDKFTARRELVMVDFLVLDEVDPRFIGSDNASDLFGRSLENIFRTRGQNKLPTIICTNSPNVIESFNGTLKQSLGSLMSEHMKIVPVFGKDYRKEFAMDWKIWLKNKLNGLGASRAFDSTQFYKSISTNDLKRAIHAAEQIVNDERFKSNNNDKDIFDVFYEFLKLYGI